MRITNVEIPTVAVILCCLLLNTAAASAQTNDKINWTVYQDMAVDLMRQYLRINTSNPPGNEIEAAKFFKSIFERYGIQHEIFEYKPAAPISSRV
jgi:hypothetical protein